MRGHDDEITTLLCRRINNALMGMRVLDVHRVAGDTRSRGSFLCRREVLGRTSGNVLLILFPRIGDHAGLDGKGVKRLRYCNDGDFCIDCLGHGYAMVHSFLC